MFHGEKCAFGQAGAAQGHLANNLVGAGDVFLFFGLFSEENGTDRHHRIFGYLQVEEVFHLGESPKLIDQPRGFTNQHPHTIGKWNSNNTIYCGQGRTARTSDAELRLSDTGNHVSNWNVPAWLRETGLTYHGNRERLGEPNTLQVVSRGQEFIADITSNSEAHIWLNMILTKINGG